MIVAAFAGLTVYSCAKDKSESANSVQQRILEAYLTENYPNAERTPLGNYILSRENGTGKQAAMYGAVYIEYSTMTLSGQYTYTNQADIARQIGSYSASNYYGPSLMEIGSGTVYSGLEELLLMMKEGGSMTAIIPPWLTVSQYGGEGQQQEVTNVIYKLQLKHVISNILQFERDTLMAYSKKYYDGMDSVSSGFYFKKLYDSGKDTIGQGERAGIWYVGKLLDGWVFDTNIADTAKKYGIYDASNSYTALDVTYESTWNEMVELNSLTEGFARAAKEMTYGDEAVTFFNSGYGYGSEGSGKIGAFQPLFFYMRVDEK